MTFVWPFGHTPKTCLLTVFLERKPPWDRVLCISIKMQDLQEKDLYLVVFNVWIHRTERTSRSFDHRNWKYALFNRSKYSPFYYPPPLYFHVKNIWFVRSFILLSNYTKVQVVEMSILYYFFFSVWKTRVTLMLQNLISLMDTC